MELNANELAGARALHPAMERYIDLYALRSPPSIYIQPLARNLVRVAIPELSEDRVPLCLTDILRIEMRISDNVNEIFEL
jgi:hypothetical protein